MFLEMAERSQELALLIFDPFADEVDIQEGAVVTSVSINLHFENKMTYFILFIDLVNELFLKEAFRSSLPSLGHWSTEQLSVKYHVHHSAIPEHSE